MSDSEEDYMSDKLLQSVNEQDIRPGLVFSKSTKRQYELEKKRKEVEAKRPKNSKEREEELREQGLNTAISSDNKGFKLLEKMGFKQGEGLGKNKSGRTEPIKIEIRQGKTGVGSDSRAKERIKKEMDKLKNIDIQQRISEFQSTNKTKLLQKFLQKDFFTAQKACENLDFQNCIKEPVQEYFWTKETIKRKRDIQEEDEEDFNEEFLQYISEENLTEIIVYLRNKYFYCIFCAFVATDEEDLNTNCPGPYREDHDED